MTAGRNLVVLADGTGNSAAKAFKTNVWRLYQALDLNGTDQIAVFSDGVGTSSFRPFEVIGLALGFGVKRRVLALYKFLCLNYEERDRIYAFGFSRGAFTIRVLVGLIHREGLVEFSTEEELDRNAIAAYRRYRKRAFPTGDRIFGGLRRLRLARDGAIWWWNRLTGSRNYEEVRPKPARASKGRSDPESHPWRAAKAVPIHFLGVWDTVAAYGLPIDELTRAVSRWVWPMSFRDNKLLASVKRARQAFSIDDERRTFFPIRWMETPENTQSGPEQPPRLEQVWFAGMHANVGGGYPDDRLAHIPLCWMINEAADAGLNFKSDILEQYQAEASESGRIYDSRSGFGVFYRYHPRSAAKTLGRGVAPLVDSSVIIRIARGADNYAPISLPENINVLMPDGRHVSLDQLSKGTVSPQIRPTLPAYRKRWIQTTQAALNNAVQKLAPARLGDRPERVNLLQDMVWWRRGLYYVTLFFVLLAALYPVIAGYLAIDRATHLEEGVSGLIAPIVGFLRGFLPGYAAPWLDVILIHPGLAVLLGAIIWACLSLNRFLRIRIHDRARAVWYEAANKAAGEVATLRRNVQRRLASNLTVLSCLAAIIAGMGAYWTQAAGLAVLALISGVTAAVLARKRNTNTPNAGTMPLRFARAVRMNNTAKKLYRTLQWPTLPLMALLLTGILLIFITNRAAFDVANSVGWICAEPGADTKEMKSTFNSNEPCAKTSVWLYRGFTYKVTITFDSSWRDGEGACADALGVTPKVGWLVRARHLGALLMKRWWTEPYFRPVARIGQYGNDEYVLTPIKPLEAKDDCSNKILTARLSPRKSGRLYLYANDAVLGLPEIYDLFYKHNNQGTASVEVKEDEL